MALASRSPDERASAFQLHYLGAHHNTFVKLFVIKYIKIH